MLKRGLGRQAAELLKDSILSGELKAGEKITEEALSEHFGVSRATIRTSIQQLVHEGIIRYEPYKGNYIHPLSSDDAWEIYTLRNALEALAANLAATSITAQGRIDLAASLENLRKAIKSKKQQRIVDADFNLHFVIFRLSKHDRLTKQYKQLETITRLYMNTLVGYRKNLEELLEEHVSLVEMISSGKAHKAEALARNHNTVDGEFLVTQLESSSTSAN